jgi:hypothetical protein
MREHPEVNIICIHVSPIERFRARTLHEVILFSVQLQTWADVEPELEHFLSRTISSEQNISLKQIS